MQANRPNTRGNDTYSPAVITSGLNMLAGIWLVIAPFVLGYSNRATPMWNDIIVGVAVGILAAIKVFIAPQVAWLGWITVLLGLWLIAAPWVLMYGRVTPTWNDMIAGVVVAILAGWSALSTATQSMPMTR